jgi:2-polyprenyl-3-methyl-5-hydroxy-6-metoxy-1,4-benzoquinol methylase
MKSDWRRKTCIVCQSKNIKKFKKIDGEDIFRCSNCGLGFILKRKHKKENLDSFYNFKEYRKEEGKLRKRFVNLIKIIKNFKYGGRVLDVGAGFGLFAYLLNNEKNFSVDVIEPHLPLKYLSNKKTKIFRQSFEEFLTKQKTQYDLITILDVLEHFNNPFENLKKTSRFLKNDGILVIQTPNYNSLMAKICKNWSWWMVEDHKYFFSPSSLKFFLKKAGYCLIYLKTYEDLIDFKKNLDGNFIKIKNSFLRKSVKLLFFSAFFSFYLLFRNFLWHFGFGGLIFALAKKNEK